jgi:hypothetical protein
MKSTIPKSPFLLTLMRGPAARLAIGGTCLWMTACASIVSKSQYPVTVSSNPPGANFTVKKASGMAMSTGVTPATLILNSSNGYFQPAKYTVEFCRKGVTQSVPLNASINGWYFGNLLFGGLIGLLIVDPATGAMWKMDENVVSTFNQAPDAAPNSTSKGGLKVVSIDQIPRSMRKHLVSLN